METDVTAGFMWFALCFEKKVNWSDSWLLGSYSWRIISPKLSPDFHRTRLIQLRYSALVVQNSLHSPDLSPNWGLGRKRVPGYEFWGLICVWQPGCDHCLKTILFWEQLFDISHNYVRVNLNLVKPDVHHVNKSSRTPVVCMCVFSCSQACSYRPSAKGACCWWDVVYVTLELNWTVDVQLLPALVDVKLINFLQLSRISSSLCPLASCSHHGFVIIDCFLIIRSAARPPPPHWLRPGFFSAQRRLLVPEHQSSNSFCCIADWKPTINET